MLNNTHLETFNTLPTPFYFYDMEVLKQSLEEVSFWAKHYQYKIHYALKANANVKILKEIVSYGFGADCVSGNEILQALKSGFSPQEIVYAGVGKTDEEILLAIENNIACFNCESVEEIKVIDSLAKQKDKTVNIALRLNPNLDAATHAYITTGLSENKFGLSQIELLTVFQLIPLLKNINISGIHVHIGSQITDLSIYEKLCTKLNTIIKSCEKEGLNIKHINLGGGLGINYEDPDKDAVSKFKELFDIVFKTLDHKTAQQIHFELGRSIVGQAGSLISKVLYIKKGVEKQFAILDAGFTELLRPALYNSFHKIENMSSTLASQKYDIVGPICESSDVFGKNIHLPETQRGDFIAIRSAGAYGEVMASQYNLRKQVKAIYSNEIKPPNKPMFHSKTIST